MRKSRYLAPLAAVALALSACASSATPVPSAAIYNMSGSGPPGGSGMRSAKDMPAGDLDGEALDMRRAISAASCDLRCISAASA